MLVPRIVHNVTRWIFPPIFQLGTRLTIAISCAMYIQGSHCKGWLPLYAISGFLQDSASVSLPASQLWTTKSTWSSLEVTDKCRKELKEQEIKYPCISPCGSIYPYGPMVPSCETVHGYMYVPVANKYLWQVINTSRTSKANLLFIHLIQIVICMVSHDSSAKTCRLQLNAVCCPATATHSIIAL